MVIVGVLPALTHGPGGWLIGAFVGGIIGEQVERLILKVKVNRYNSNLFISIL